MSEDAQPLPPEPGARASGARAGWLPVLAVVILMPLLSYAMAEFLLIPRLQAAVVREDPAAAENGEVRPRRGAEMQSVDFPNVVSNLTGSLQSRYIKVSFTVYGSDPDFRTRLEANRTRLLDTTLGVLGGLSVADLERPGIKNQVRSELMLGFEHALRAKFVEELYFSEFVIQ
ncbi:MAG: flagellar basal body protein FliL [Puniceicoccaceae bacterium]|nr:MAG: flagellar basal body protein FliL [Puniceicoccaceae bacterium]